tara:strand:- start:114 stop:806 length:693 start_codon:yes stop_codon:yes gene_type:complete
MADRIPLIVNPSADQIQELPNGDSLNGIANITATGTVQAEQLTSTDDANIADDLTVGGEITAGEINISAQPSCLLTVPVNYTAENTEDPSNHVGGQNFKPIAFTNETTRVGCTTSLTTGNAQGGTSGITSITVPSAGTYLVSAMIGGAKTAGSGTDQIRFGLSKSGDQQFPNELSHPTFIFGDNTQAEFNCTFTLPLTLSANDILSVHLAHIGASKANIQEGYFSVTKLH